MRGMLTGLMVLVLLGCAGSEPAAEETVKTAQATKQAEISPKTVTVTPPPPPVPDGVDPAELAVVREYTQIFYRGEIDLLHAKFSSELRESIPLSQLSTIYESAMTTYGKEKQVVHEASQRNEEYRAFVRFARFDKTDEVIEIQWILRAADDQIAGFFIRPARRQLEAEGRQ